MTTGSWLLQRWEVVLTYLVIGLVLVGGFAALQPEILPTTEQRLVKRILLALEKRHPQAYTLSREYLTYPSSGPFGIALAAGAASLTFQDEAAIDLYHQLPADGGQWEFLANMGLARRCLVTGRLTEAERHLRRAQVLSPNDLELNSRLGHILQTAGRTWEAVPLFFLQIMRGKCRGDELLGVASPEIFFRSDPHLEQMGLLIQPPEVWIKLANARRMIFHRELNDAEMLLKEIIETAPDQGEAQGRLGRIIYERGNPSEFTDWQSRIPDAARSHPEVWLVQGLEAHRSGQHTGAIRCFLETLILSPNHREANDEISVCLNELKEPELAEQFAQRGEQLARLEVLLDELRQDVNADRMQQVIVVCEDLGRFWEAAGWSNVLTHVRGVSVEQNRQQLRELLQKAFLDSRQNSDLINPVNKLRREDFAEPDWTRI